MTSPIATDQLGHDLAMQLRAAYSLLRRSSNLVFSSFGMTSDQYVLLTVLLREGDSTQQDLVRHCYSDTATMGSMVYLLEAKGLLARTPHPQDGRAWRVALTRAGRALAEEMRLRSSGFRANLAAVFEEQELRSLIEYLGRLAEAMPPPERKAKASRFPSVNPPQPKVRTSKPHLV